MAPRQPFAQEEDAKASYIGAVEVPGIDDQTWEVSWKVQIEVAADTKDELGVFSGKRPIEWGG